MLMNRVWYYIWISRSLIGNKEYEIRIAQIKPILEKLKEQYPDQAGVLHLENYEADSASINFTPQS